MSSTRDASVLVVTAMPITLLSLAFYWASSIPDLSTPDLGLHWQDKLLHAMAYFVYGCATCLCVVGWTRHTDTRTIVVRVLMIAGTFAVLDEVHQTFVPGRDGSWADAVADLVGILVSFVSLPVARKIVE